MVLGKVAALSIILGLAGYIGPLPEHEGTVLFASKPATRKRIVSLLCAMIGWLALPAAAEVSPADLHAAVRALGFLSSLQNRSAILIGVVYNGADPAAKASALRAAGELSHLAGPGSAAVTAVAVATQELGSQHFDALYLMTLPGDAARPVGDYIRRQSVVSVSSDPQCLEMQTCVLLVQSRQSMSVVLDTGLAKAVGAKFSTVFTMLVKRR